MLDLLFHLPDRIASRVRIQDPAQAPADADAVLPVTAISHRAAKSRLTGRRYIETRTAEGVTIRFASKVPGTQTEIRDVTMDFGYGHAFTEDSPEAYERLILDVLLGEPPLFPRQAEVELSWRIVDPFEEHWASLGTQPEPYAPGTWGPPSADALMARDGRSWRRP